MNFKQRNRMVVFRLTEDEYESLRAACASAGARNLSDYTRSGLLALWHTDPLTGLVQRQLADVSEKLGRLEDSVTQLAEEIADELFERVGETITKERK